MSFIEWKSFLLHCKPLICKKQGKCGCYSDATPAYSGLVWNIGENSTVRLGAHWQLNSCGDISIISMIPNNMNKKINIFFSNFCSAGSSLQFVTTFTEKRGRCKKSNCAGIPKVMCTKCKVHLCFTPSSNYFMEFHK